MSCQMYEFIAYMQFVYKLFCMFKVFKQQLQSSNLRALLDLCKELFPLFRQAGLRSWVYRILSSCNNYIQHIEYNIT